MALSIDDSAMITAPSRNGHGNGSSGGNEAGRRTDAMEYEEGEIEFKPLWQGSDIDRREFVRLTMQTLMEMGYS